MLETIKTLVQSKNICVLATCSGDLPHTSLMAYTAAPDAQTFWLLSGMGTRKMRNLRANPQASLLMDTREQHLPDHRDKAMALTVSATYLPPRDREELMALKEQFAKALPHMKEFADRGDTTVITLKAKSFLLLAGLDQQHFIDLG
ncbi:pyridoxamine 5'-phosphate oxidase family protein [Pseudodesulfovibrio senegalensis]|jgi:nitroimidazol reductase NimA-like FMN-containing flavoprotein (pyridoxamine 5'-phosphate oxidase superfamily)|uniref:Pyridoxamine 5'-phosphate oxidase family protein n=1 Tax=Pseudodesulfovibrio senegalensis TaxID=1721087 RepID=A0A6N6N4C6_9BACT|nr:pyridoxamine 5'-phosphate oxidase family protein [Pseudodesulfovibrio senegalensis]KAB1442936.1 pyridoxamine 5'-phosphate oxidase family protein [Pseudodesulfovibrio senegalensis]